MRRAALAIPLALLLSAGAQAQPDTPTATPTETPTATVTQTATETATPTIAPTVADSSGLCVATGDKAHPPSALSLDGSPSTIATLPFVVAESGDPYFFLCEVRLFNQANHPVQVTLTMRETGGLFAPETRTTDVPGGGQLTYQIPLQTWGIAPGAYTLECLANAGKKRALIAQPASYAGVWRLGSSAGGCPAVTGGGNLDASGATFRPRVCMDEVVSTQTAAAVTTTATLIAGSIVNACLTRTNAVVTGGYRLGLPGAADMFGAAEGSIGDTNAADVTLPAPVRVIATQPVLMTSTHPGGAFLNDTGRVRVVCFCDGMGAPTQ